MGLGGKASDSQLTIREEGLSDVTTYCQVPIAFEIRSRLDLDALRRGRFVEIPLSPTWKDYDLLESPAELPLRFDTKNWRVLSAFRDGSRVGGAIVARDTEGFDMLQGRRDLVVIVDLRVLPPARGQGVGRALFEAAKHWALAHGCGELNVETQDNNVEACRFYLRMGCRLASIELGAYGPETDEAKLIWRLDLR